jgi:hypothetical protein
MELQNVLDKYNTLYNNYAYSRIRLMAKRYVDESTTVELMNAVIDASLELCGDPYYKGSTIRALTLASHVQCYTLPLLIDLYLTRFAGE